MMAPAALSVLVLLMGAALFGLSEWFITATGLAGLVGTGIALDVFCPLAGGKRGKPVEARMREVMVVTVAPCRA